MVNLLFLLTTAWASDVYEVCMIKNQTWSERYQRFETTNSQTFYSFEPIQFIVHQSSIEINRDSRPIQSITTTDDKYCIVEHEKSKICLNEEKKIFEWEWVMRSGVTKRDLMYVCSKNGEAI